MKKYDEEFQKTVGRNRMSFIATLAVAELIESGRLTKEELTAFVEKNAQEQKKPERAEDLIKFINETEPRDYLPQFGWRIFDLKTFYEERKKSREEIHAQRVAAAKERERIAKEERAAQKAKNKQNNQPKKVEPAPAPVPKKRIIVVKKKPTN